MVEGQDASFNEEAAGWVAEEVDRLGGRLTLHETTLADLFLVGELDQAARARIIEALAALGLGIAAPQGSRAGTATIFRQQAEQTPPRADEAQPPPARPPQGPTPAEALSEQAAALPSQAVAAGVLVPGLAAATIGGLVWAPFALMFLGAGLGLWFALRRARFWFARLFFWPFRSLWASGFLLALAPMLLLSVLLSAAFVAPVAARNAADKREREAASLIRDGKDALADGDLDRASRFLDEAREKDGEVAGDDELEQAIADEERARDQQNEYEEAKQAIDDDGDPAKALLLLSRLEDSGGNDALAERVRRDLAEYNLRSAKRLYAEGSYSGARAAAARSDRYWSTPAAQTLRRKADQKVAQEVRAARAEARRLAAVRAAKRAQARREAAAREAERAAEEEAASSPYDSSGSSGSGAVCSNGSPVPEYPGQRDGDGDGCYGER